MGGPRGGRRAAVTPAGPPPVPASSFDTGFYVGIIEGALQNRITMATRGGAVR